jgi:hypothetical protein
LTVALSPGTDAALARGCTERVKRLSDPSLQGGEMSFKERMMDRMMKRMSSEEKVELMDNVMEKFLEDMTPAEMQKSYDGDDAQDDGVDGCRRSPADERDDVPNDAGNDEGVFGIDGLGGYDGCHARDDATNDGELSHPDE